MKQAADSMRLHCSIIGGVLAGIYPNDSTSSTASPLALGVALFLGGGGVPYMPSSGAALAGGLGWAAFDRIPRKKMMLC